MMNIFGKQRDSLEVRKVKVVRARYMDGAGTEEVELSVIVEGGHRLDLRIPHRLAPEIIGQMTDAYEAIAPPLSRRSNYQASWDGAQ